MAEKEEKIKRRTKNKRIAGRILAAIIAIIMILATASTFIYYIISNI